MKTLVTYYSFTGNTDRIAGMFVKLMDTRGSVDVQRLKPAKEITDFFGQCMAARMKQSPELAQEFKYDMSSYDLLFLASPVWAFAPAPAINTYIKKLTGLNGKRVIVLLTSGSGVGVKNCFKYLRRSLETKGAARIDEINIPDKQNSDNDFIISSIQKVL